MEYLVSHKVLAEDPDEFAAEPYFFLWKRKGNWPYLALKTGDVLYWYRTPSQCLVWKSEVLKVATFEYQDKSDLLKQLNSQFGHFDESHTYWKGSPDSGYCLAFKVRPLEQINIPKPPNLNFSPTGWMKIADSATKQWVSDSEGIESSTDQEDAEEETIKGRTDIGETTKTALIKSRRGQGIFKKNVQSNEKGCRVTGITDLKHLRASHIKPWKDSSDEEKLNGCNGLLLAPHVDHLFDKGYISFKDSGEILVSDRLGKGLLKAWGISADKSVGVFKGDQIHFLEYHRERVFK